MVRSIMRRRLICGATAAGRVVFQQGKVPAAGPLIDLGVHVIDLARYVMGNPKAVSVYGATFDKLGNRRGSARRAAIFQRTRVRRIRSMWRTWRLR